MTPAEINAAEKHWPSLISSGTAAVVVGFASTILVVVEGLRVVGANPAQQASAAAVLCYAMAATSFVLALRFRMPIMVAWSTPGAVLLATSGAAVTWPEAIGAFMFAGVLMLVTALVTPLARAIEKIPASIAAAMLAGILLRYVLGVPAAALEMPHFVLPMVVGFFALRFLAPMFAVPILVAAGLLLAVFSGNLAMPPSLGITALVFQWPQWNLQALVSLGIPLYLVTMASQNLPGFAVLRASGYAPPVTAALAITGLGSILAAPFGSHAINMAAITAAIVAGPDCHPDPAKRWKMIYPYTILYLIFGLGAGAFVTLLANLPKELVTAIAGLALFGPLIGGMTAMVKEPKDIEPALVTFLVTASGLTVYGVGAAFWGLMTGIFLWSAMKLRASKLK